MENNTENIVIIDNENDETEHMKISIINKSDADYEVIGNVIDNYFIMENERVKSEDPDKRLYIVPGNNFFLDFFIARKIKYHLECNIIGKMEREFIITKVCDVVGRDKNKVPRSLTPKEKILAEEADKVFKKRVDEFNNEQGKEKVDAFDLP